MFGCEENGVRGFAFDFGLCFGGSCVCVLGLCSYVFMFRKYSNLNSSVFRFLIMFFIFFILLKLINYYFKIKS